MSAEHKDISEQTPATSLKSLQYYMNALRHPIKTMMAYQREVIINSVGHQVLLASEIIKFGQVYPIDVPLEPFEEEVCQASKGYKMMHSTQPTMALHRGYGLLDDLHLELTKIGCLFDQLKRQV